MPWKTENYIEIVERVCPVCGKTFIPAVEHVYRRDEDRMPVCSWSCLCAYRRGRDRRRGGKVLQFSRDGALIAEYPNVTAAALVLGCDPHCIRKCCRKETRSCAGYIWRYADREDFDAGTPGKTQHDDVLVGCMLQSNGDNEKGGNGKEDADAEEKA